MVGTVEAKVLSLRLGESSKKKSPRVEIEFAILDGTFKGESFSDDFYLSEAAIDRTVDVLRILGWQGDDLSQLGSAVGGKCQLVLKEEEYDGKVKTRTKFVNPPGGGNRQAAPMSDDAATSLANSLKARIRSSDAARAEAAKSNGKAPF
jgi:hypothetical protein